MSIRSLFLKSLVAATLSAIPGAASITSSSPSQFQQPTVIPTGNWPSGILTADLNGDGKPDLIYTDYGATATTSTTHILLGNGNGTFSPGQTIGTAGAAIAVADFDQDGHPDLEWVWSTQGEGRVFFAQGHGDGTFGPPTELGTFAQIGTATPQFSYVMGARMHDTGDLDLLVEDVANSALFELTSDSSGTLVRLIGIRLPDGAGPMTTADLNGDGHTDLLIQGISGRAVDVFLGSANGILQKPISYTGRNGVQSMLLHDLDADGHPDLLIEGLNGHLDILHGFPDGSFASTSEGGSGSFDGTTGVGGHLFAVADLNTSTGPAYRIYATTPTGISVLQSQSNLSLTLQGIYNAGPGRTSFAVADFNSDGSPDLAVDSPEGIAIVFGNEDGSLKTSLAFSTGKPALSGVLGAFSSSATLDAAVSVAATQAQFLHGNGDGTFSLLPAPTTPQSASPALIGSVAAGDFNGDGKLDLAITQNGSTTPATGTGLSVQYGNGDGTFGVATPLVGSFFGTSVSTDLNGDGIADLANVDSTGDHVLSGQKNGTFTASNLAVSNSGSGTNLVASGDLNHDGMADLVFEDGGAWRVYLSGGGGGFVPSGGLPGVSGVTGMVAGAVSVADLDGDGNGDVVVAFDNAGADHAHPSAAVSNSVYIWYGKGDGTFDAPVVLTPSRNYYQLAVVDIDGDGKLDLVMSDGYLLSVQRNLGNRRFGAEQHLLAGMGINGITAGDVNSDGLTDLVIANGGAVFSSPVINHGILAKNQGIDTGGITVLLNASGLKQTSVVLMITTPSTIFYGQVVDGYAQVTASDNSVLSGTITFFDGATNICVIPVAQKAGCPASAGVGFAVGTHLLTAVYSGDATHAGSTSNAVSVAVLPDATTTSVVSSVSPAVAGQSVAFTATVRGGYGVATGAVTFLDGGVALGTALLNGTGVASYSTSSLGVGTHTITASYVGDGLSAASVSAGLAEVVSGSGQTDFTIEVGPVSVVTGKTTSVLVKVSPLNGFNQAVQLDCSDLPNEATCTFATATIPAGGGTTMMQLSALAPRACSTTTPYGQTAAIPFGAPVLAGLVMLFVPKRRRALKGLLAVIAMCGFIAMTGCGACTDLGTKPGTYTIKVTGLSTGAAPVTNVQKVQVTVN
jgi:hypothetical protein